MAGEGENMDKQTLENVDKTINAICDWLQKELKSDYLDSKKDVAEMTKALAELMSVRADNF